MPTEAWVKERQLITFHLLKSEAAAFRRACKAAGKRQTDVLRETVQVLIEATDDGDA